MLKRTLITLTLLGALGATLPGCIVVDNKRGRSQTVSHDGKHRHEHCHAKKHGKRVCHSHPHGHPHH
jgi:hypothetical protein